MALSLCYLLVLLTQFLLLVCCHSTKDSPSKPPWNETWTDKLKRHLLTHYDKFARPAQHNGNTTVVNIHMTLRHVDLDELKAIMTVHAWVKMSWIDEKLKWNDSEWGGLRVLHIADHEIWQPDIVLYNSATGNTIDHYASTHCLVYRNGEVLWVPPTQFIVFCDLDLRLWPFDTQTCYLRLGSWTYDGEQVDLQTDEYGAEIRLMVSNSEWDVEKVTDGRNVKYYSCCPEPYIDVTYNVTLRRRSPAYSAIVITPATVIVLMTLSVFWLPPQAGEKLMVSACTAIIICIFLLFFSQKLPAMAGHTPLVVLFYSTSLYLVCISMLVSVIVLNLSRNRHGAPLPWIVKNVLTGWLGHALGLGHIIAQASALQHGMMAAHAEELREHQAVVFDDQLGNTNDDSQMIASSQPRASTQHDWVLLAAAIDRITFLLYSLLFVIFAIVYSV